MMHPSLSLQLFPVRPAGGGWVEGELPIKSSRRWRHLRNFCKSGHRVTAVKPYERYTVYAVPLTSYCCSECDQSAAPPHTPTPTTLKIHTRRPPHVGLQSSPTVSRRYYSDTDECHDNIIFSHALYIYIHANNHVSAAAANPSFSISSDTRLASYYDALYCSWLSSVLNWEIGCPRVRRLMTRLWRVIWVWQSAVVYAHTTLQYCYKSVQFKLFDWFCYV